MPISFKILFVFVPIFFNLFVPIFYFSKCTHANYMYLFYVLEYINSYFLKYVNNYVGTLFFCYTFCEEQYYCKIDF